MLKLWRCSRLVASPAGTKFSPSSPGETRCTRPPEKLPSCRRPRARGGSAASSCVVADRGQRQETGEAKNDMLRGCIIFKTGRQPQAEFTVGLQSRHHAIKEASGFFICKCLIQTAVTQAVYVCSFHAWPRNLGLDTYAELHDAVEGALC